MPNYQAILHPSPTSAIKSRMPTAGAALEQAGVNARNNETMPALRNNAFASRRCSACQIEIAVQACGCAMLACCAHMSPGFDAPFASHSSDSVQLSWSAIFHHFLHPNLHFRRTESFSHGLTFPLPFLLFAALAAALFTFFPSHIHSQSLLSEGAERSSKLCPLDAGPFLAVLYISTG
ncbi:hypothetical protein CBOM_07976 [Ceraceosorus bombacis]|uniref:Uncharacterized protein n=1 Tax=Ceraceosorus bombacis TaxID=401625 RepID=A0A0N7LBE2_9BASI|nr:hypothetical protein CBOM_07976 [Ceraceosorus bombacis]